MAGYTSKADPEKTARAIGKEMHISPKASYEICNAIRGKDVNDALDLLDEVIELKRPIKYKRFNKYVAHKKGTGPGRYPQKAARAIKKVIETAQANAEYKELDPESMRIKVIAAHRGQVVQGTIPRAQGRATDFNEQTTNIEIVLESMEE